MTTLTDGHKTAEIVIRLNGKDYTAEFLKDQGIIPNRHNTTQVPNIEDIINAMIEFEDADPENRECEVTFLI